MEVLMMTPDWQEKVEVLAREDVQTLAEMMLAGAIADCPVGFSHDPKYDAGHLKSCMYVRVTENDEIILGNSADYAYYVEMGHFIPVTSIPDKTAPDGWVEAQSFLRRQVYRWWGNFRA